MKRIISTVTSAALLAGALFLPAVLRAEEKSGGKEGFSERKREKLGITEEQETKLKAARRAKRDAAESAMSKLKASKRKLHDQLEDKASDKDLSATLGEISAARKEMRAAEEKFEASLASILTPTQQAKMIAGMRGHGKGGGAPWKKGGEGAHDGPGHDDD